MNRTICMILAACLLLVLFTACGSPVNPGISGETSKLPTGASSPSPVIDPTGEGNSPVDASPATMGDSLSEDVKIIPGASALDAFPANFSITWTDVTEGSRTLLRKDGSWYTCVDMRDAKPDYQRETIDFHVAVIQPDGSYTYYGSDSEEGSTYQEKARFDSSNETLDSFLEDRFALDLIGATEFGTPSTWLQMCKDYEDGTPGTTSIRFIISKLMKKQKTEVIAGVPCDVVLYDGGFMGSKEYAFDPETGILFRFGAKRDQESEMEYTYTVTEYTVNPATLGNYPG